ncbi:hypothetical protein GDO81_007227 [Engystomops pustulosus]|uniref:Uncharacterized protein n=1 Tax=Engystomops pustulosus TaxID=76066 RepID=A0AAV7C6N2_ENGPU|nr:hypothetical protein GDO81_007227 [Engystomops pustulosus]
MATTQKLLINLPYTSTYKSVNPRLHSLVYKALLGWPLHNNTLSCADNEQGNLSCNYSRGKKKLNVL